MTLAWWVRGVVWMAVGAGVFAFGLITGHQLIVPRSRIPWGLILVGLGLVLLAFDNWRAKRKPSESKDA